MPASLCRIRLNLDHLRHNMALLRASGKPLMPVVKADAYGHGLREIAGALRADRLAVGAVAEGVLLRQSGFAGEIVALLGAVRDEDITALRSYRIVPLAHEWSGLRRIADAFPDLEADTPLPVAVKYDTGMSRLGFSGEELPQVAEFLAQEKHLRPDYFLSHLAAADVPEEDAFTRAQAESFRRAGKMMRGRFPGITLSLGNSACILAFPELTGDLGRPGIALYGGNPFHGTSKAVLGEGLETVMEAEVPILSVHGLRAGTTLGYGRAFTAPRDMWLAVAGVGYADAFRRNPPVSGCAMTLHGCRVPVLGRVAMQMTCLDIGPLHEAGMAVRPGDSAFVLGGKGNAVTLHELANWWATIPHEVTCLLGKNRTL